MAKDLVAAISSGLKCTYKKTGNDAFSQVAGTLNETGFVLNLINGLGDANNVVNLLYAADHEVVNGADVALNFASIADVYGDTVNIAVRKLLFIQNLAAAGSGYEVSVAAVLAAGVLLQPQAFLLMGCGQLGGLADVPASITLSTTSVTGFDCRVVMLGIND